VIEVFATKALTLLVCEVLFSQLRNHLVTFDLGIVVAQVWVCVKLFPYNQFVLEKLRAVKACVLSAILLYLDQIAIVYCLLISACADMIGIMQGI
jgi:hypothetical protein